MLCGLTKKKNMLTDFVQETYAMLNSKHWLQIPDELLRTSLIVTAAPRGSFVKELSDMSSEERKYRSMYGSASFREFLKIKDIAGCVVWARQCDSWSELNHSLRRCPTFGLRLDSDWNDLILDTEYWKEHFPTSMYMFVDFRESLCGLYRITHSCFYSFSDHVNVKKQESKSDDGFVFLDEQDYCYLSWEAMSEMFEQPPRKYRFDCLAQLLLQSNPETLLPVSK